MSQKKQKWIPWGVGYLRNDQMPFDGVVVSGETLWSRQKVGSKEFILCHVGSLNIWPCLEYPKSQGFIFELEPEDSEAAVPFAPHWWSRLTVFVHCSQHGWKHHKLNVPKIHHRTSDPKIFISHIPVLNFARTALHVTLRMCGNPSWTNVPKIHHKTSDPKIFISHIPLWNFAGTALHVTPRICANPSWTNVPKIHHKTSDPKIFISHTLELCRNSSPCYTTHLCQPILNQRPKDTPQNLRP